MEAAHRAIGGIRRGRRYAVEQINHAYAVLLSSQFQGFCRDLHSETANALLGHATIVPLRALLTPALLAGRMLDSRNANPASIGSDFNRFGLQFWDEVRAAYVHGEVWRRRLEELNEWRNAVAHQNFKPGLPGGTVLRLSRVQSWRRACDGLARAFDSVMRSHLKSITNTWPW